MFIWTLILLNLYQINNPVFRWDPILQNNILKILYSVRRVLLVTWQLTSVSVVSVHCSTASAAAALVEGEQ